MKKRLLSFILAIIMVFSVITPTLANTIKVTVNSKQLEMPVAPVMQDGRTLVPLRAIFEALGLEVGWNGPTQTVTGTKEGKEIKLTIDNPTAIVDGEKINLDVPAKIINGSTMVPVRFVSESLGANVNWDGLTQTVVIQSLPTYKVARVVDGDTIIIDMDGKQERVRLIGIDTPESVHPDESKNVEEGKTASNFTKGLLEGKEVGIELDVQERDHYGRILAYVYLGNKMFNKTLLEEGYAKIATYPPNVKYVTDFKILEQQAREQNKGLWGITTPASEVKPTPEVKPPQPTTPTVKTEGKYVGSLLSDKYHSPTCRWAKNILKENEIWFDTLVEAKQYGYTACGTCNPR